MVNYRLFSYGTDERQFICLTDTHSNDSFHHSSVKKQPKKNNPTLSVLTVYFCLIEKC